MENLELNEMKSDMNLNPLNEKQLFEVSGGRSFAYDAGWVIRLSSAYVAGPSWIAAFWTNEAAVEAIEAM